MARIQINGLGIEYQLLGQEGAPAVAITPGGRFAMDSPGVPELGQALAAGGKRVLLWDRPNCGASDVTFEGDTESNMQARTLVELIRALKLGPTAVAAGSGGSRVSLVAASYAPDLISHVVVWWISGGALSLISLASYYCVTSALAAAQGGMEAVANLPAWAEQIKKNPRNREYILSQDPDKFIKDMERWAVAYLPQDDSPVPGMSPESFARLKMPVLIYRSGKSDLSHTRATSEWVHKLIPQSKLIEPPWGDTEWNSRSGYAAKHGAGHFAGWPALAPAILDFTKK